ncbi:MAG: hypothetical protein IT190_00185 [Microbacteriaceae bacterium]|nr:hypothetical protein [Microbacteriaceae bacterium]
MIEWFTLVHVVIAVAAGILCITLGFARQPPNDYSLGAVLVVEVLLLVQLVVAIAAPAFGNHASGSPLEFYTYLVSAIILLPAAVFWSFVERTKWSTVILGVAALAVAIMLYRMHYIWTVQFA